MKKILTFSLFVLMCFVSCDSFTNPEIGKIKAEVERQNKEKEEIRGLAVKKAMELFNTKDEESFEHFFFTHEVVVFKDKKTSVCLPMVYRKNLKELKSFGFIKDSVLYIKDTPSIFRDYLNYESLETLVEKHCDVDEEYLRHRDRLIEKEEQEKKNIDKEETEKTSKKLELFFSGIGDGSLSNFEQMKYWRKRASLRSLPLTRWSNISKEPMELEAAKEYCENLVEQGNSDWRLPMLGELRSLVTNCFNTEFLGPCRMRDYQFQNYLFRASGPFGPGSRHLGMYCIDDSICGCSCYTYHCKGCEPAEDGRYSRFGDRVALHSLNGTIDFKNAKLLRLAVDDNIPLTFVRCIRGETSLELDAEYYYNKERLKERLDFNRKMEQDDEKN